MNLYVLLLGIGVFVMTLGVQVIMWNILHIQRPIRALLLLFFVFKMLNNFKNSKNIDSTEKENIYEN